MGEVIRIGSGAYPRIYKLLLAYGYAPSVAWKTIIDAQRGDTWSMTAIEFIFLMRKGRVHYAKI